MANPALGGVPWVVGSSTGVDSHFSYHLASVVVSASRPKQGRGPGANVI